MPDEDEVDLGAQPPISDDGPPTAEFEPIKTQESIIALHTIFQDACAAEEKHDEVTCKMKASEGLTLLKSCPADEVEKAVFPYEKYFRYLLAKAAYITSKVYFDRGEQTDAVELFRPHIALIDSLSPDELWQCSTKSPDVISAMKQLRERMSGALGS